MRFVLEQSDLSLSTHSGLALIGLLLKKTQLRQRLNQLDELSAPDISHADVASSYLGLLAQGKSDFEDIEPFRRDEFFAAALACERVPSAPTLRQRFDEAPHATWETILREEALNMLRRTNATFTPVYSTLVPLDADVSPFDNSASHKEGVELTYKKVPGYAPIFFYLGREGYLIDLELRRGSTHSQSGMVPILRRALASAGDLLWQQRRKILVRLDAAHDDIENIKTCHQANQLQGMPKVEWLIKRNLRKESLESWREIAVEHGALEQPRPGKRVWTGSIEVDRKEIDIPLRIVFHVVERTIKASGQVLLIPELEVETYWTSLLDDPKTIIALYHDHGTMEQFHSELKSELELERLPSGKFATNSLILHFGMMAYNLLRRIGQESLQVKEQPLRKKVKRRRVRTVIQNLITIAARVIQHARTVKLAFGRYSPWYNLFRHVYLAFST